jgi:DNA-binding NtrC family response regulator
MTIERPARRAAKVLIVDDDPHLRSMLTDLVKTLGCEAACVSDGAAALRAIVETRPDVVLLDILMPGLSGLDLLPSLQALAPGVPVIMLSGTADEELGRQALARGAFDYVVKPVDLRRLAEVIDLALL